LQFLRRILTPPRTLVTVVNSAPLLIAPLRAFEMASVIPFATSRCVCMMVETVFAMLIPAPPIFEEMEYAMLVAQVPVANTTLEIVAT